MDHTNLLLVVANQSCDCDDLGDDRPAYQPTEGESALSVQRAPVIAGP